MDTEQTLRASLSLGLPSNWRAVPTTPLGPVPSPRPTPDIYGLIEKDGKPFHRFDLYKSPEEADEFREIILWDNYIAIGFGHKVFLVSVGNWEIMTMCFDGAAGYFGHFYSSNDFLLAASGEQIIRFRPDAMAMWISGMLGMDGVEVEKVEGDVIEGKGEWDPPGGWRPFRISLNTGKNIH